ncbi:MAG: tripartite tricarboxylate transporter permease [Clostridia bacterium]|nr:tripartite tricarboxylate transporter permease [Clostridia bacterium]
MYESALDSLITLFTWPGPLYLVLGSLIGILFGILPGLGGPQVVALLLPLTIGMDASHAIILLIGAMAATAFGGSIPAILINTPGTATNAATCLDGFPLARQGKAGMAIATAGISSALGAIFGAIVLTLILPMGRQIVLAMSFAEYFMMAVMGIAVIVLVSRGSIWKGIIAGLVGFMLSSVGYDPVTGIVRYTFGVNYLYEGVKLMPVLIGLFAIAESIELFIEKGKITKGEVGGNPFRNYFGGIKDGFKAVFSNLSLLIRSSFVGVVIGVIPGVGGAVANFMAYVQAQQTCKNNENFGKGDIRGVIAPESANNSKDGGALVPTLIFGIPGSIEMAVLLGALTIHGITPGPQLMLNNPSLILILIYTLVIGNIFVSTVGVLAAPLLFRVTTIPTTYVAATVFTIAIIGAYATDGIYYDAIVTVIFGIVGFTMKKLGFSRIALVIALMLGQLAQKSFHQALIVGGPSIFFTRPISLILFIGTVVVLSLPFIQSRKKGER